MRLLSGAALAGTALAVAACGPNPPPSGPKGPPKLDTKQLVSGGRHGVVQIYGELPYDQGKAWGTGWFLNAKKGIIVTAAHVVAGIEGMRIHAPGASTVSGKVLATFPCEDVAFVQADGAVAGARSLALGDSTKLEDGDPVVTLGFPSSAKVSFSGAANASSGTITTSQVSNVTGSVDFPRLDSTFMYDAAIAPGTSGGPLLNQYGQVVGINDMSNTSDGVQNQNYAVPSAKIKSLLAQGLKGDSQTWGLAVSAARHFGIGDFLSGAYDDPLYGRYWERYAQRWGGVFVTSVDSGSAADDAHIAFGDYIESINGKTINSVTGLCDFMKARSSGDRVKVEGYHLAGVPARRTGTYFKRRLEVP